METGRFTTKAKEGEDYKLLFSFSLKVKCLSFLKNEKILTFRFHVLLRVMNIGLENQSSSLRTGRDHGRKLWFMSNKDTFSEAKSVSASNDLLKDLTRESN